jgi:hypothetical protein
MELHRQGTEPVYEPDGPTCHGPCKGSARGAPRGAPLRLTLDGIERSCPLCYNRYIGGRVFK